MKVTIELIDELRSRVDVSYEEAKRVLEANDGDLISSIIQLEKERNLNNSANYEQKSQNKTKKAKGKSDADYEKRYKEAWDKHEKIREERHKEVKSFFSKLFALKFTVKDTKDKQVLSMPFVILVLLCIPLFWLVAALVIVGYFMGYRMDISSDKSTAEDFEDLGRKAKDMATAVKNEFTDKNVRRSSEKATPDQRSQEKETAVDAEIEEVEVDDNDDDEEAEIIVE